MASETRFKEFIESIPHGLYKVFRRRMMEALYSTSLEVSEQTVRNWEAGRCEPTPERREVINGIAMSVAGKRVYDEESAEN